MIQRIQSIFILVAAIAMASLVFWPIDSFGSAMGLVEVRWNGIFDVTPATVQPVIESMASLAIVIIAPIVLNLVGLFLFKVRTWQMKVVGLAAGFEFCVGIFLIYLCCQTASGIDAQCGFNVRWLLPFVATALDVLAYRRISDDEELVRSLNRLR